MSSIQATRLKKGNLILLDGARLLAEPSLVVDDAPDPGGNTTTRREGEERR